MIKEQERPTSNKPFKEWCKPCKKYHIMIQKPCPVCGVYEVPQPKSEKVADKCRESYLCDGCEAYQEHLY